MKKIKFGIIIFLAVSAIGYSCNKDLNEIVYHDVTAESYKYNSAYEAIGAAYTPLRSLWSHQTYYMANETSSDELVMPANASGWDDGGIYRRMHLHTWNSENPQLINMWTSMYQGVINANNILDQFDADKVPIPKGVTKESLVAEVHVARAFYYWLIVDNFGDAALVTTTSNELPKKTLRKDIYQFVVDEISQSLPDLSEDNNQLMYGRFNKWAAKSLLANVYLNAEVYTGEAKWDDCLAQCDDIITAGKYSLEDDYRDIFMPENQNSTEIIFSIPFDKNVGSGFYPEMYSWHGALKGKRNMQATPWGSGSAMGISQFIDTYDADDSRLGDSWLRGPQYALDGVTPLTGSYDQAGKPLVFTKDLPDGLYTGESEGYRMNKFEVEIGALSNLSNDFPFFRYAEVLLMKAECLLHSGKADDAAQLVTKVRERAFKTHPEKAIVTGAQLSGNSVYNYGYIENFTIVDPGDKSPVKYGGMLDELGWEFAWEGHRRRDDIRFGVYTTKSWLSHKPNGEDRATFMIPQAAINSNPNLK
jgi:hypothetical protein